MKAKIMKKPNQEQFRAWLANQPGNSEHYTDLDTIMVLFWVVLRSEAVRVSILAEIAETEVKS